MSDNSLLPLLVPGATCWKKGRAWRLSLIQDGEQAFDSMSASIELARHTVFILGWDFDSRTVLRPGTVPESHLLPVLCNCLDRAPDLQIFVLIWDFSFIYAFERESDPLGRFGKVHPRLHFALDERHAVGASHHQKVVVVDDQVAFIGGIDLTTHRWDTPHHYPIDARRIDAGGALYGPFHDVQAAVSGPAASYLGELARARWQRKHGCSPAEMRPLQEHEAHELTAWPEHLSVDAVDVDVGLARTLVQEDGTTVREIEALTLNSIAAAERWIYAENQYLTSDVVQNALAARLMSETGPEIVLLLPATESGWKEQSSMGILRAGVVRHLRQRDRYGRLRLVTPQVWDGKTLAAVEVHAKVLVVDDAFAKIGSANFSRRSMGLDSECDLAVEAYDENSARFIASVRNRLLAEHLGISVDEVALRLAEHGSLCRLIDEQPAGAQRRLVPPPAPTDAPFDLTAFDGAMVDPPGPWTMTMILDQAVPTTLRHRLARRWLRPLTLIAIVIALWLGVRRWHFLTTAVPSAVADTASMLAQHPGGPLLASLCFALAASLFVPVTLLITATIAVFGMWPGVAIAWLGSLASATLSHALGNWGGPRIVGWLPERIEASLRRFLKRQPFWAVVLMRIIPIANFGVLNIAAGAFRIPRRAFVLGNMVGMLPGLLGLGVLISRVFELVRRPSPKNIVIVIVAAGVLTALAVYSKHRFRPLSPTGDT